MLCGKGADYMLSISELSILESLSHGGKELKTLLTLEDLSTIAGVPMDNKSMYEAFTFLQKEKLLVQDAMSGTVILTPAGKTALEKADHQRLLRQNFQMLDGQLKAANELSESLIKELHDQAERADKQRKVAEKKQERDKWIQLFLGWLLGIGSTVIAQVILKWIG